MRTIDIISDIHGDLERMEGLLETLGYDLDTHSHPEGHVAAFLGDFIDRGPGNLAVLRRMNAMRQAGSAVALMGNHELNAILFHTDGADGDGLRSRSEGNIHQHESFLREAPLGSAQAAEALAMMMSLPLAIEVPGLRLVHACWSDGAVAQMRLLRPDLRLRDEDLVDVALERDGSAFAEAVTALCKGPEIDLPPGSFFLDTKGTRRDKSRARWWSEGSDLHSMITSIPDYTHIANCEATDQLMGWRYPAGAPPVAFGHYQLPDIAMGANVLCLDVPGRPMAYRWQGEASFQAENVVGMASPVAAPAP